MYLRVIAMSGCSSVLQNSVFPTGGSVTAWLTVTMLVMRSSVVTRWRMFIMMMLSLCLPQCRVVKLASSSATLETVSGQPGCVMENTTAARERTRTQTGEKYFSNNLSQSDSQSVHFLNEMLCQTFAVTESECTLLTDYNIVAGAP